MGLVDLVKDQFLDVIEFEDLTGKLVVSKFRRESGNNELKQGSRVVVREGQSAVFLKGGRLADVLLPGTYALNTGSFPVLTKLEAFPFLFTSPVISDVYFVSTKQFIDNKWATKTPVMKRDQDFGMVRIRAFGKFAFQVVDVPLFMREVFGAKGITHTFDIIEYLSSMVVEAFATAVGESPMSVVDLSSQYRDLSTRTQTLLNTAAAGCGISFSSVLIEGISLPDEFEKLIDEQSKIELAKRDMHAFMQYHTALAMRDATAQDSGFAGLGVGVAMAGEMSRTVRSNLNPAEAGVNKVEKLRELKTLLDDGILTPEEFESEKRNILGK